MTSFGSLKSAIFDKEQRKQQYQDHIRGLNAYDRHKKFLKDYVGFYGKESSIHEKLPVKTDQDTLREGYRFIRSEEDDMDPSWEQRLVKRYYDKLFKEYCIADMSHYKSGKIGLRWRTEKEVISGKVHMRCAEKLNYKKRKEKEQSEKREKEEYKRKRGRSKSDDNTDNEYYDGSKERRKKGKKASTSAADKKIDDDENFDEYLQGMFP